MDDLWGVGVEDFVDVDFFGVLFGGEVGEVKEVEVGDENG